MGIHPITGRLAKDSHSDNTATHDNVVMVVVLIHARIHNAKPNYGKTMVYYRTF